MDRQDIPIQVLHRRNEDFSTESHSHQFNELVFISSGNGKHYKGAVGTPFTAGQLFVVSAGEAHSFEVTGKSEIYLIRFTEEARLTLKELVKNSGGRATGLTKAKSPVSDGVSFCDQDKLLTENILSLMLHLSENAYKNSNLLYFQMLSLVSVIERNTTLGQVRPPGIITHKNISAILSHIHKHLQNPEMLRLRLIAQTFNMSTNTLMLFFRQEMQQTVKQYADEYRMKLLEKQVVHSDISFSELAFQFGFVDESHFNRRFRHAFGSSPREYRKACSVPDSKLL